MKSIKEGEIQSKGALAEKNLTGRYVEKGGVG